MRESFVRLWGKGLIYRGARIVNWDCVLMTAVSDDEIDYETRKDKLYELRYPVKGRDGEFVTVGVKCSVRGLNHTLLVMSRPDQAHIATLMCLRDNVQRAAFTLRASRSPPGGHSLLLDSTCFDSKRVLHRDLRPVLRFLAFYGDRAGWGGEAFKAHPNLAWYRRMVLGLPPPQPEPDLPI